ncbi:putative reverse transcriptase domain-containing protein [Tanacetum coccineum]
MSMTYQPQTDGQSERTIQTLEDRLRACVIDFGGSWDVHLPLAEFSYNNSYHTSIRCALFEALYGRKYRSPVLWAEIGEGSLIGPELVQETTDKVVVIKEKLKAARDCQKIYTDNMRKLLEFEVGDRVMLKVSPWKGVVHFGKKGKLAPRYVGPFEILERIGPVTDQLRLSKELIGVHDMFHVSNLKKCLADTSLHVPLDEIKVDKTLCFVEEPVKIMDREIKCRNGDFKLRTPRITTPGLLFLVSYLELCSWDLLGILLMFLIRYETPLMKIEEEVKVVHLVQGTVSSIPIVGSISPEGFLSLILLVVVIIATVVVTIVVVVIVGVVIVVAVIGIVVVVCGVSFIIKLSFMVIGFFLGTILLNQESFKFRPGDLIGFFYSNRLGE